MLCNVQWAGDCTAFIALYIALGTAYCAVGGWLASYCNVQCVLHCILHAVQLHCSIAMRTARYTLCSGRVTRGSQADQSTCILSKPSAWLIITLRWWWSLMWWWDYNAKMMMMLIMNEACLPVFAASEPLPQFRPIDPTSPLLLHSRWLSWFSW